MARCRGFTILEMMVVVSIALAIMLLVVPIFQVSTRTVRNVEEKLAAYEAARNILDIFEQEIRQSLGNERGEHFSIKSSSWDDTDPFTPVAPAGNTKLYYFSRREADGVQLIKPQPGSFAGSIGSAGSRGTLVNGSMTHPFNYPTQFLYKPNTHEAWFGSMRSTLLYPLPDTEYGVAPPNRATMLNDVSLIETSLQYYARANEPYYPSPPSGGLIVWPNENANRLTPGNEIKNQVIWNNWISDYTRMHVSGINLIDFDVAWWDQTTRKFRELESEWTTANSVVYFAPAPKTVRITITVCDRGKRKRITLCRLVQVPTGMGAGSVENVGAALDTDVNQPNPFNRAKNLGVLEAGL
ncbi:MAG: type II secretion system protein [Planctomycetota bacterium]|nr:type II secretion system protein [Planctomycetota bacterium]